MSESLVFDLKAAMDRVDNDKELLRELVQMMTDQYPLQIGEIEGALKANNAQALGSFSHAIKSALGNLGAMRCYDLALALEKLGKSGSTAGAEKLLAELKAEFESFKSEAGKL